MEVEDMWGDKTSREWKLEEIMLELKMLGNGKYQE